MAGFIRFFQDHQYATVTVDDLEVARVTFR